MSSTYTPVGRKSGMIGCNIKPGFRPGSFSHCFAQSTGIPKRSRNGSLTSRQICEAANRVLEKRGLINEPNQQDSTQTGGFRNR